MKDNPLIDVFLIVLLTCIFVACIVACGPRYPRVDVIELLNSRK